MLAKRCPICGRKLDIEQRRCSSGACPYVESTPKASMIQEQIEKNEENKEVNSNGI